MALGDVIKRLAVSLSLETAAFEKGATLAEKRASQMQRKFEQVGGRIAAVGQKISTTLTPALLGVAAAGSAAVNQLANDAAEMKRAAQTAGAGFEEFQRAAFAASTAAGVETAKLGDILRDTAEKIGDFAATGGGELQDFFKNIAAPQGLNVEDFLGKSSIEQLRMYVAALENAGVSSEEMVFYLESIADEGSALLPILQANGAELDRLGAKAAVIDPAAASDLKRYTDAQTELSNATRKLTIALVESGFVDLMTDIVTRVANFATQLAAANPTLFRFGVVAAGIGTALGPALMGLGQIIAIAPKLVSGFGLIRAAAVALMAHPVLLAFSGVIAGIYFAWRNWDKIEPILRNLYNGAKKWLLDKLGAVFDWVRNKIKAVTGFFFDMYDAVVGNSYVPDMVDGIAAQMARLQSVMVDPAQQATQSVTDAARNMASEVSALLDRLFPEIAAARQMIADRNLLRNAGLDPRTEEAARLRLVGGGAAAPVSLDQGPLPEAAKVNEAAEKMSETLRGTADRAQIQTVRIAESFRDMAQNSIRALDDMVNAIKGGGFLDILGSAVNLFLQLGGSGLFGGKLAANINGASIPGFAQGTRYAPGGPAWVGERGPELVNLPRGSQVISNRDLRAANGNGKLQVEVIANNNGFGAIVRNHAGQVVAQATPTIAAAGAEGAMRQMARKQYRRLA